MAKLEPLDPVVHANLRLRRSALGERYGKVPLIAVVATELATLAVEVPVCLVKDSRTGQFGLFAVAGLHPGSNSMIANDGSWRGQHAPFEICRGPFRVTGDPGAGSGVIMVDVANTAFASDGEALFTSEGKPSPIHLECREALRGLLSGVAATRGLIEVLEDHDLIVPARIESSDGEGSAELSGLYTIDVRALERLDGPALVQLNAKGYFYAGCLLATSMANVGKLRALNNSPQ